MESLQDRRGFMIGIWVNATKLAAAPHVEFRKGTASLMGWWTILPSTNGPKISNSQKKEEGGREMNLGKNTWIVSIEAIVVYVNDSS